MRSLGSATHTPCGERLMLTVHFVTFDVSKDSLSSGDNIIVVWNREEYAKFQYVRIITSLYNICIFTFQYFTSSKTTLKYILS